MKKGLIFSGGFITGIVITFLVLFFIARCQSNKATYFETPGEIVEGTSFEVFQVIEPGAALVNAKSDMGSLYLGAVYLIVNNEGKYYYDDEIINVPKGKVIRQVGIYKYPTKDNFEKTVPIIQIMDR